MAIPFTTETKRKELETRIEALENKPVPPPLPAEFYLHSMRVGSESEAVLTIVYTTNQSEAFPVSEEETPLESWVEQWYENINKKVVITGMIDNTQPGFNCGYAHAAIPDLTGVIYPLDIGFRGASSSIYFKILSDTVITE